MSGQRPRQPVGHAIAGADSCRGFGPELDGVAGAQSLGRLAVGQQYQNQGLGQALLRDAMLRAVNVASNTGVFGVMLHSISEQAKRFYLSRGFVESPLQPMTLMMTLETIRMIIRNRLSALGAINIQLSAFSTN
ncbi:MAG: GNAT family N-acetyltransferase [Candidatus Xenobia bacterium]